MSSQRVDLSVLRPFSRAEIANYLAFLGRNGAVSVAAAVEAALGPDDLRETKLTDAQRTIHS